MANATLHEVAKSISRLKPEDHPMHSAAARQRLGPIAQRNLAAIEADPTLTQIAKSKVQPGSTTTDPTGSRRTDASVGWGPWDTMRNPKVRHVLLGFTPALSIATGATVAVKATPNVDFKANRMEILPGFNGVIAGVQSGIRPQYVSSAAEDADMYQPLSYGGELDLDAVKAAVAINGQVTNNAVGAQSFWGAFIGQAIGMKYRPLTSKLMVGSLGTSGSVAANGTGSLVLTPAIAYRCRKVLVTPGAGFGDAFIITSIQAGIQPQLMSPDPIPASVFTDLYPLFVDFDPTNPSVPLTIQYQNVSAGAAVLKGSTRGDVNKADLAQYENMSDIGGQPAGG